MTKLHGGICHRTTTPHKSGNKVTRKKKSSDLFTDEVKCQDG